MNEKELRDLIKSQLKNVINEAKGLKLKVEVPMRDPEIKKFIHNYLLLNKKYSMHRMPEYSMKFGENKWKKETHWKFDTANNILYVHDEKVVDQLVKGGAPSDLFESNLNENKGQDLADKYVAILRKEFRKLNDDELDEFKKTIAQSLDLNESISFADDINDPFMVRVRIMRQHAKEKKEYQAYLKANPKPKVRKISFDKYLSLLDSQSEYIDDLKELTKELKETDSDMNQEAGQMGDDWTDDDANRYGEILNDLEDRYSDTQSKLLKITAKIDKYNLQ